MRAIADFRRAGSFPQSSYAPITQSITAADLHAEPTDYRIGPEDLLSVFDLGTDRRERGSQAGRSRHRHRRPSDCRWPDKSPSQAKPSRRPKRRSTKLTRMPRCSKMRRRWSRSSKPARERSAHPLHAIRHRPVRRISHFQQRDFRLLNGSRCRGRRQRRSNR